MDDPLRLLHAPLGIPGSGRVRYGAAMELFQRGVLSEAQLDCYREASPFDGRDPASLIAERGLPAVPPPTTTPEAAWTSLFSMSRDYLNGLSHPGHAEVSDGFGRCTLSDRLPEPTRHPVPERWLAPALQEVARAEPQLAAAIKSAEPHLAWVSYDAYPRDQIGESFATGHAFASVAGKDALFVAEDFELGLFLIAPHVLYRDHRHPASELYAPLTGPHGWRFAPGRPLFLKPAGEPVWNPPLQPHLTKVGTHPFLCLFAWTRDVNLPATVIPAADWPQLEELRIDP